MQYCNDSIEVAVYAHGQYSVEQNCPKQHLVAKFIGTLALGAQIWR